MKRFPKLYWLVICYFLSIANYSIRENNLKPDSLVYLDDRLDIVLILGFTIAAIAFINAAKGYRIWACASLFPAVFIFGTPFGIIGFFTSVLIHGF